MIEWIGWEVGVFLLCISVLPMVLKRMGNKGQSCRLDFIPSYFRAFHMWSKVKLRNYFLGSKTDWIGREVKAFFSFFASLFYQWDNKGHSRWLDFISSYFRAFLMWSKGHVNHPFLTDRIAWKVGLVLLVTFVKVFGSLPHTKSDGYNVTSTVISFNGGCTRESRQTNSRMPLS